MKRLSPRSPMKALRRVVQVSCLCLFVFLVMLTRHRGDQAEPLLQVFLDLDPLVAVSTRSRRIPWRRDRCWRYHDRGYDPFRPRVLRVDLSLGAAHQVMTWLGRRGATAAP